MRLVLLAIVALALTPGAAAEEMEASTTSGTSSTSSTSDPDLAGPDPPPGSPCRPTCSPTTG